MCNGGADGYTGQTSEVVSPLEIATFVSGLLSVWLTVRQNIWCWPAGITMVLCYGVLAFQVRLYSDVGLQLIYLVMQIYGWYHWLHGGRDRGTLPVTTVGLWPLAAWILIGLAAAGVLGVVMSTCTDADLPYWNAMTTALSLVAQWFLARKKLESWAIWITVDVLYIGMFVTKRLYLMACLYAVFLVLSGMGFHEWRKSLRETVSA